MEIECLWYRTKYDVFKVAELSSLTSSNLERAIPAMPPILHESLPGAPSSSHAPLADLEGTLGYLYLPPYSHQD